jgi:hypothetical protein
MRYFISLITLIFIPVQRVYSIPVVPNFGGATTNSTGFDWSLSGTNLNVQGKINPDITTVGTHSVSGVTTTHFGVDPNTVPDVTMHTQGAATQLLNSYQGPGLKSFTRISRDIITESVTNTMSTFSN